MPKRTTKATVLVGGVHLSGDHLHALQTIQRYMGEITRHSLLLHFGIRKGASGEWLTRPLVDSGLIATADRGNTFSFTPDGDAWMQRNKSHIADAVVRDAMASSPRSVFDLGGIPLHIEPTETTEGV